MYLNPEQFDQKIINVAKSGTLQNYYKKPKQNKTKKAFGFDV